MTYYQRQLLLEQQNSQLKVTEYLIPSKLVMHQIPSAESNETVPFPRQPELRLYDLLDRWVEYVGTEQSPWIVTASLVPGYGDPNARLEGTLKVSFVNGTARFSDLSISHNGTGYKLLYNITYPLAAGMSIEYGNHVIKERKLGFRFTDTFINSYEGIPLSPHPGVAVYDLANGETVSTGWKGREWIVNCTLSSNNPIEASLYGLSTRSIVDSNGTFTNLSIDTPGTAFQIQYQVKTIPASSYFAQHLSNPFDVKDRMFYVHIAKEISDCNDTVVCGQQPNVQIRSVAPDIVAGNLQLKNKRWFIEATLCPPSNSNPLKGTRNIEIPNYGEVTFKDLHFDYVTSNINICFNVSVQPTSKKYKNLSAVSASFSVAKRQMYLYEMLSPGDANETIAFGQQPIIDVRDFGTGLSASPLYEQWSVTVSLATNQNNAVLSGTTTVPVVGTYANFTDLTISKFGIGFVLKYRSSYGNEVRLFFTQM